MPIHLPPLPPVSRRQFLRGSLAASIAAMLPRELLAAERKVDPHTFALLADTHIHRDAANVTRGANMADNLAAVVKEVLAMERRPAAAFINGDLALSDGQAGDYDLMVKLLKPLREGGVPVDLTLGNHDDRKNFRTQVPGVAPTEQKPAPVEDKHVSVVESERGNFFLLDSLHVVNKTPGRIGEAQLRWLAAALDKHKDKPALVMAHHTPHPGNPDSPWGVQDTDALFDILQARRHVKAFIYGHSHNWALTKAEDLHLINQPPVAYVFAKQKPNGWVRCTLLDGGAELELVALDKKHDEHGKRVELKWRD